MAHLNVAELGIDQRVVGRQIRPTRDPEDVLHALGLQRLHQCVSGSHQNRDGTSGLSAAMQAI
jgi:hypothetical protein